MLLRLSDREVLLDQHVVMRGDRVLAELTPLEAQFLAYLAAHPGEVVPREVLLREVWGYAPTVHSRAIDKAVHRLRLKLEPEPAEPRHLVGVRSMGYRLADQGLAEPSAPERPAEEGAAPEAPLAEAEAVRHLSARAVALGADAESLDADRPSMVAIVHSLDRLPGALEVAARELVWASPAQLASALLRPPRDPVVALPGLSGLAEAQWHALPADTRAQIAWLVAFHGPFTRAQARAMPGVGAALPLLLPAALAAGVLVSEGQGRLRFGALVVGRARRLLERTGHLPQAEILALEVLCAAAEDAVSAIRAGEGAGEAAWGSLRGLTPALRALVTARCTEAPSLAARALSALGQQVLRSDYNWVGEQVERILPLLASDDPASGWMHLWRARVAHCRGELAGLARLARFAIAEARGDAALVAEATIVLSTALYWGGEDELGIVPQVQAALIGLRGRRASLLEARLQMMLGLWYDRAGQPAQAVLQYEHAAAAFWRAGDVGQLALTLTFSSNPLRDCGRLAEARSVCELSIAGHLEVGAAQQWLHAKRQSANLHHHVGELDAARDGMLEVLKLGRERGDRLAEGFALDVLGLIALERGLYPEARVHLMAYVDLCIGGATPVILHGMHHDLGLLHHFEGDLDEAAGRYDEVLRSTNAVVRRNSQPSAAALRALIYAEQGDAAGLAALGAEPDPGTPGLGAALALAAVAVGDPPGAPTRPRAAQALRTLAGELQRKPGGWHRLRTLLVLRLAERLER